MVVERPDFQIEDDSNGRLQIREGANCAQGSEAFLFGGMR